MNCIMFSLMASIIIQTSQHIKFTHAYIWKPSTDPIGSSWVLVCRTVVYLHRFVYKWKTACQYIHEWIVGQKYFTQHLLKRYHIQHNVVLLPQKYYKHLLYKHTSTLQHASTNHAGALCLRQNSTSRTGALRQRHWLHGAQLVAQTSYIKLPLSWTSASSAAYEMTSSMKTLISKVNNTL